MPATLEQQAVYLQSGDPELENTPILHAPGLLGVRFIFSRPKRSTPVAATRFRRYQLVRLDPATATPPLEGAPAYWGDKANYVVTTAIANRGQIAGIFRCVVTAGNFCCVQIGGPGTVKLVDAPTAPPTVVGLFVTSSATILRADSIVLAPTFPTFGVTAGTQDGTTKLALCNLDVAETV